MNSEEEEVSQAQQRIRGEEEAKTAQVSCIVANKKGFVVGSDRGGFIGIYEIEQKDSSVNHLDTFKIDQKCSSVCGLGTSSDKSRLIISALLSEPCPPGGSYFNSETRMERIELYSLNMQ